MFILKGIGKWIGGIIAGVITLVLLIVLLPHVTSLADRLLPKVSGEVQESIELSRQLQSSARLETTSLQETGVITHDITAFGLGVVSTTSIHYEYEASIGVDLRKADFQLNGNRVTLVLPALEVLQDSLTALATDQEGEYDRRVRMDSQDIEALKEEEKLKLRAKYLSGDSLAELRAQAEQALRDTILAWLSESNSRIQVTIKWVDLPQ